MHCAPLAYRSSKSAISHTPHFTGPASTFASFLPAPHFPAPWHGYSEIPSPCRPPFSSSGSSPAAAARPVSNSVGKTTSFALPAFARPYQAFAESLPSPPKHLCLVAAYDRASPAAPVCAPSPWPPPPDRSRPGRGAPQAFPAPRSPARTRSDQAHQQQVLELVQGISRGPSSVSHSGTPAAGGARRSPGPYVEDKLHRRPRIGAGRPHGRGVLWPYQRIKARRSRF